MTVIIRRAEWGARPAVGRRVPVPAAERRCVVVHHTTGTALGKADPAAWVRSIQRYHQSVQGWSDIGYHWLVDGNGRVFEGRGWDVVGAHCPGHNTDGWGIALLGDGTSEVPTDALEAIGELLGLAEQRAGHPLTLLGHRDAGQTACPGDALYAWVHDVEAVGPTTATSTSTAAAPVPAGQQPAAAPAFPLEPGGFYGEGGVERGEGLKRWQSRMRQRGWKGRKADGTVSLIEADGDWGPQTAGVTRAFQTEKHLDPVDERIGKVTWAAAWTEPVT